MLRSLLIFTLSAFLSTVHAFKSSVDTSGYFYIDSDEAALSHSFTDISGLSGSTAVSLRDDESKSVAIGFPFKFYNVTYTSLYISSNGFLSFSTSNNGCCSGSAIPSNGEMGTGIAAWWEDLNPSRGGTTHFRVEGSAPNRIFIVQMKNIPAYSNSGRNTFQYKLYETTNVIEVHYNELFGDNGNYSVGIQGTTTVGTRVYFGSGGNTQNANLPFTLPYAIRYQQQPTISSPYISTGAGFNILAGNQDSVAVEFNSTFSSNKTVNLQYLNIPVQLNVNGPSSLQVAADNSADLGLDISTAGNAAEGLYTFTLRVSSADSSFDTFDILVRVNTTRVTQLSTNTANESEYPSVSADGKKIVLSSRADLASTGKSNNRTDLFLYNTVGGNFTQLTQIQSNRHCYQTAISGNGLWAAAVCNGRLDPAKTNNNNSREVFLINLENKVAKQIGADINSLERAHTLALDYEGEKLLFVASTNLVGTNADGSLEVFSYDRVREVFEQLSDFNAGTNIHELDIDNSGQRLVVSARANPFGTNNSNRYQVFSGNLDKGVLHQVTTNTGQDSRYASISGNGEEIVFSSRAPLLGAGSGRYNVFVADFPDAINERVTNFNNSDSYSSDISSDGSSIVFTSNASLADNINQSSNREVFVYNRALKRTAKLSEVNESRHAVWPKISENGSRIVFTGTADWISGQNPNRINQVFSVAGLDSNSVTEFKEDQEVRKSPLLEGGTKVTTKVTKTTESGGTLFWLLFSGFGLALIKRGR